MDAVRLERVRRTTAPPVHTDVRRRSSHDHSDRYQPAQHGYLGHRLGTFVDCVLGAPPMVSKVRGHFNEFSGAVVVAADGTPSVNAALRRSVDTRNEQRDAHLKARTSSTPKIPDRHLRLHLRSGRGGAMCSTVTSPSRASPSRSRSTGIQRCESGHGPWPCRGIHASVVLNRKDFGIASTAAGDRRCRRRRQGDHHARDRGAQGGLRSAPRATVNAALTAARRCTANTVARGARRRL